MNLQGMLRRALAGEPGWLRLLIEEADPLALSHIPADDPEFDTPEALKLIQSVFAGKRLILEAAEVIVWQRQKPASAAVLRTPTESGPSTQGEP
jgi:hypothetical protein